MRVVEIDKNSENQRLDKFLLKYFNKAGKSFIYKMLRKKRIKYNGKKAQGNEILVNGDVIQMYLSDETVNSFIEEKSVLKTGRDFSVIYEDENIIICNKPAGLAVQKDFQNKENVLNDQLLFYLVEKGEYVPEAEQAFTPSICNRLDRNTSGIVLFGKNFRAVQELNAIIKNRKIDKFYLTLVDGVLEKDGHIEAYHLKEDKKVEIFSESRVGSKKIITNYKVISQNEKFSLAEVELITGRTHQIRACFKFINHCIVGDRKYGKLNVNRYFKEKYDLDNQFLHAYKVVFNDIGGFFEYLSGREFFAPIDETKNKIIVDLFGERGVLF